MANPLTEAIKLLEKPNTSGQASPDLQYALKMLRQAAQNILNGTWTVPAGDLTDVRTKFDGDGICYIQMNRQVTVYFGGQTYVMTNAAKYAMSPWAFLHFRNYVKATDYTVIARATWETGGIVQEFYHGTQAAP
jgi:hypothetical protein